MPKQKQVHMKDAIVAAEKVFKTYDNGAVTALRNISLMIRYNEYIAIMGPSGSGKSTLINLLSGLDRPTKGRILFEGRQPANNREWTRLRAERIGFVFQSFNLLPYFTALENIEIAMFGVNKNPRERQRSAIELLSLAGLASKEKSLPGELSCGERQRVAICRSLANSPDLLLADEPTGNLDSKTSEQILKLLETIHEEKHITLVLISHDPQITERAGRIINIVDGAITSLKSTREKSSCGS
jgi:putative ABC transport system ATP-binding protein